MKGMSARIRCQMDASSPPPLPHSPNAVIMEWDLVLFPDDAAEAQAGPRGLWNVGKVEEVREHKGECTCQPLYQEAGTGVWLESHERGPTTVRLSEVRAMDTSTYDFAQRMAPDRVSNPHGTGRRGAPRPFFFNTPS